MGSCLERRVLVSRPGTRGPLITVLWRYFGCYSSHQWRLIYLSILLKSKFLKENMDFIEITEEALKVDEISAQVTDTCTGATSLFVGTTRDNFNGKKSCKT